MPNWCDCELDVQGENAEAFVRAVATEDNAFCFNSIVPQPEGLLDRPSRSTAAKYSMPDWYDWRIENWGTKWESCDAEYHGREDNWFFRFQTAWSPPTPVVKEASRKFSNTVFALRFYEGGMGMQGFSAFKNGEPIASWQGEYEGDRGG